MIHNLTFTAFSDMHDNPGKFYTNTAYRLKTICEAAVRSGSTLILHAGDLCHDFTVSMDIIRRYQSCGIPSYHTLGNHDCELRQYTEVIKAYGMPAPYYYADIEGFRFVFTDTNYFIETGEFIHFSAGNHMSCAKDERYILPPEELLWLKDILQSSPYPCIVISHHSFIRDNGGVLNGHDIREILIRSGKVMLCINGHYHRDNIMKDNGICWFELNSTSYNWLQKPHDLFPKEITDKYILASHTAIYNDPLYATITVSYDGTVAIRGIQSSFYMGVSREVSENEPLDECGRPAVPFVSSMVITGCNTGFH